MDRALFTYHLPANRIAQSPLEKRDHSKLLHLNRSKNVITHHHFYDLPKILRSGDVLVLNSTRVIPARIAARKLTGGLVEVLLTRWLQRSPNSEKWEALTRPGLAVGQTVTATANNHQLTIKVTAVDERVRTVELTTTAPSIADFLHHAGQTPLPPYIHQELEDANRYQTIYAKEAGAAAAPTAGLHFTPELLTDLKNRGITILEVTLHVSLATFLAVKVEDITQHKLHKEWFKVSSETADKLTRAKAEGRRIIAVGTTALRTLETIVDPQRPGKPTTYGQTRPLQGETDIFLYPPHHFRSADGLITNFHEPQTTLMMLVSAFASAPNSPNKFTTFADSPVGKAYQTALENDYRFLSFGDAMLITNSR